jgi:hypothetical protein
VIRKDVIANVPIRRMQDTLDYHSSPEQAAQTATRSGVGTLVLTHYVPPIPTGGDGADWRALAAAHFGGTIELGDDLHRVVITPTTPTSTTTANPTTTNTTRTTTNRTRTTTNTTTSTTSDAREGN